MKVRVTTRHGLQHRGTRYKKGDTLAIQADMADTLIGLGWVAPTDDEKPADEADTLASEEVAADDAGEAEADATD